VAEEITNPRQYNITSDGSPDHQGEYTLTLHYYYASDPRPAGKEIRSKNFLVTILPWDNVPNRPPYLKEQFNETYVIRVNENLTIFSTPVDEDQDPLNLIITTNFVDCPRLSDQENERLFGLF